MDRNVSLYQHIETGYSIGPRGLYYKTLSIRNLWEMDIFCSKLVSFLLRATNTLAWTNTLAYYGIRTLQTHHVFIVQAPWGLYHKTYYSRNLQFP